MSSEPNNPITLLGANASALKSRYGLKRLAVFGSWARGGASTHSDCDILVEFSEPATFDKYFDLKEQLETILVMPVDLVTINSLHFMIRDTILREAIDVP